LLNQTAEGYMKKRSAAAKATPSDGAPPAPRRNLAPSEISPQANAPPPLNPHGECSMCRTDRRMCDGGRPCTRCV